MEKLQTGDIVVLKRTIFAAHKHLGHTGIIVASDPVAANIGTIFVEWEDGSKEWVLASWLLKI